ncbi:retrovirus-related pol polyprotein from transposon TNT 1-94 [Tanacetum coccineum]
MHLKTIYKNLFDSINVTRAQPKIITESLQDKLHDTIYENAKLRAQLFDKVSEQKDTNKGASVNTQFCKQSVLKKPPSSSGSKLYVVTPFPKSKGLLKIDESHALSKPVTSNSVPTPQESKVVKTDKVIAPGMFRNNPFKTFSEEKCVPNKPIKASVRTKPITVSQPHVIPKKDVNSDSNDLSSTGVDITTKTRRPQPRGNTKNDRVPSASKSSCIKNKEVEVEEHHRNLLRSKNKNHMSYECKNVKLAIRNDKSKVVCAMCKQCLITANHDVCVLNYVNGMNSSGKKQKANVSNTENKKKQMPMVKKPKKVGSKERLVSPTPSKPKTFLRWSPTGRIFDLKGKIITYSESECQSDCSNGKIKKASHPPKPVPNSKQRLHLLHMDLCGPMRVASINGKRYVLVIMDDYSRYTWEHFLRSKDEAPEVIKIFLKKITVLLQAPVISVRNDNDT